MPRKTALAVILMLTSGALGLASSAAQTHTETFDLASATALRVRLRVGDLKIVKGADARHVVIHFTATSHDQTDAADRVKTSFQVKGSQAELNLHAPKNVNFDVRLEVPAPTDLTIRMSVGDLTLEGVEGNLDIEDHVGDLTVKPGPEKDYGLIEASTHIGDLDGLPGNVHGWLGKSGRVEGGGQYHLHAHVGIGDVRLVFD